MFLITKWVLNFCEGDLVVEYKKLNKVGFGP